MIKELVQFTEAIADFKSIGLTPKEGIYIRLRIENKDGGLSIDVHQFESAVYSKKMKGLDSFLKTCTEVIQSGWMVNTNKCFDTPEKAIHSCSPYMIAFKKDSLTKQGKGDSLAVRLNRYFTKAKDLVEEEVEKGRIDVFKNALNSDDKLNSLLQSIPDFDKVKEGEYVVVFLDEPIEKYRAAHDKYLQDKLFNTNEHNTSNDAGETVGTSDFFNGFNVKKPFLLHQSAAFSLPGRITAGEAKGLYDFREIVGRSPRILPQPLPIFIYKDELTKAVSLFREDADADTKKTYAQIFDELYTKRKVDLKNFYLLFYSRGEIKDFDFVSRFEYELKDKDGNAWQIQDLFEYTGSHDFTLENVFELQPKLMLDMFNNALIVKTKTGDLQFRWFDDIDAQYCKSDKTYLLVLKYRKAFYDFIYKSRRQAVTQTMFEDIMLTGILEDIRLDKVKDNRNSEYFNILKKLNILFSLHNNFQPYHENPLFMANQTIQLREFMAGLAREEGHIQSDEQFAFAIGQVVHYILSKSKSEDRSYKRLEPFLQQTEAEQLRQALVRIFNTYKHEPFSRKFRHPFAEVMGYETKRNMRELLPMMLAGYFSKNQLFADKQAEPDVAEAEG
jgi:CRISPR-associated protein Csh1